MTVAKLKKMNSDELFQYVEAFKVQYIDNNLTRKEMEALLGVSHRVISYICKTFDIVKSIEKQVEGRTNTFIEKYGVKNISQLDTVKEKKKQSYLSKYGVDHPLKDESVINKMKQTNLEKYGTECPLQRDDVKQKIFDKYGVENVFASDDIKGKIKNTMLDKYGVDNISKLPEIREKAETTMMNRYGVKYAIHDESLKDKIKQTNLQRYGVEYTIESSEVRQKIRETWMEKYGRENVNQRHIDEKTLFILSEKKLLNEFLESIEYNDRTFFKLAEKLGVSYSTIEHKINEYELRDLVCLSPSVSFAESNISNLLTEMGVDHICGDRKVISPYEIDILSLEKSIGIEYNGYLWHSTKYRDKMYHQNKSFLAQDKGVFLYHIFEYEWNDIIKRNIITSQLHSLFGLSKRIFARNCEVRLVNTFDSREFLNFNHLQGYRNSSIKIGLYYKDELVSIMTFGKSYLSRGKYEYELHRFCNKLSTTVVGGASKLFKYFLRCYNPKDIISFSDIAKGTGQIYEVLGFKLIEICNPNYVWVKNSVIKTRYQCQMKNEKEIMSSDGYCQVYDCGNYKWVWNL